MSNVMKKLDFRTATSGSRDETTESWPQLPLVVQLAQGGGGEVPPPCASVKHGSTGTDAGLLPMIQDSERTKCESGVAGECVGWGAVRDGGWLGVYTWQLRATKALSTEIESSHPQVVWCALIWFDSSHFGADQMIGYRTYRRGREMPASANNEFYTSSQQCARLAVQLTGATFL